MDITGVDFITVPTRDFDRASAFYTDVLGLECSTRWGQMPAAEFETGTLTIAVMQSDAFGSEFQRHSHPIALHVADVAAAREELEGKGVTFAADTMTAACATWRTSPTRTATRSCCTRGTRRGRDGPPLRRSRGGAPADV